MSNELIERLAREAGIAGDGDVFLPAGLRALERFAALVAEQCARKVELSSSAEQAASAIRAAFPMPKDEAPPTAEQWTADEIAAARSSGAAPLTFNKISGPMPKD